MRRSHFKLILPAILVAGAILPSNALASSFSGSFSGKASVKVKGSSLTIASVSGSGSSTLGKGSLSGKNGTGHTNASEGCGFFKGSATISGSNGSIYLSVSEPQNRGCGTGNSITVKGSASVTGGTGKYKGAKGTLSYSGKYNKATGAFSVSLHGTA